MGRVKPARLFQISTIQRPLGRRAPGHRARVAGNLDTRRCGAARDAPSRGRCFVQHPSATQASGSPQSQHPPGAARWKKTSWPSWLLSRKQASQSTQVLSFWHVRQFHAMSPAANTCPQALWFVSASLANKPNGPSLLGVRQHKRCVAQDRNCLGGADAKHRLAALAIASVSPSAWAAEAQAANSCGEKRSANGASDERAAFNNSVGLGSDAWTGVNAGSSGSGWLMFIVFVYVVFPGYRAVAARSLAPALGRSALSSAV